MCASGCVILRLPRVRERFQASFAVGRKASADESTRSSQETAKAGAPLAVELNTLVCQISASGRENADAPLPLIPAVRGRWHHFVGITRLPA